MLEIPEIICTVIQCAVLTRSQGLKPQDFWQDTGLWL
jgi:hypothetical protein